jgi:hypothetical protein
MFIHKDAFGFHLRQKSKSPSKFSAAIFVNLLCDVLDFRSGSVATPYVPDSR